MRLEPRTSFYVGSSLLIFLIERGEKGESEGNVDVERVSFRLSPPYPPLVKPKGITFGEAEVDREETSPSSKGRRLVWLRQDPSLRQSRRESILALE